MLPLRPGPIFVLRAYVNAGHFGDIEDTVNGFLFGVVVMMGITLILAIVALRRLGREQIKGRRSERKCPERSERS